jgi:hypothetical protein
MAATRNWYERPFTSPVTFLEFFTDPVFATAVVHLPGLRSTINRF